MTYFEKEFNEFLKIGSTDITEFLKNEYSKSYSKNYYDFLDTFLFKYGVLTINIHGVSDKKNKYQPYIKLDKKNIFNINEDYIELSNEPISDKTAQIRLAHYLISKLNFVNPSDFINWKNKWE